MTRILFMGRKAVASKCLEYLLTRPDVEIVGVLTDSHLTTSVTARTARAAGLEVYEYQEALEALAAGRLECDLALSMLYWRKLKGPFLTLLRGCINFHPAPLPEYRGVGGYNLAVLRGLEEWAASAHYVDAGIDTGPIISVRRFPINPLTETAQSLEEASREVLYKLFVEVADRAVTAPGLLPGEPNEGGFYLSRPELEAMKRVTPGADDLDRRVRAFWFPPYDGAYIEQDGQKFTLVNQDILRSLADPEVSSLFAASSGEKS